MYERGNGVKVNMEKAAELYMWAAERGYASAQFNLGTFSATTTPHHSPPLHPTQGSSVDWQETYKFSLW